MIAHKLRGSFAGALVNNANERAANAASTPKMDRQNNSELEKRKPGNLKAEARGMSKR
jgi:hypothetical protein